MIIQSEYGYYEKGNILKQCEPLFSLFKENKFLFEYITITYTTKTSINKNTSTFIYIPDKVKIYVSLNGISTIYDIPINEEFNEDDLVLDVKRRIMKKSLN